jgi:hypothetical protein
MRLIRRQPSSSARQTLAAGALPLALTPLSTGSEHQSRDCAREPLRSARQSRALTPEAFARARPAFGSERQSRELTSEAITHALQAIGSGPLEPGDDADVNRV